MGFPTLAIPVDLLAQDKKLMTETGIYIYIVYIHEEIHIYTIYMYIYIYINIICTYIAQEELMQRQMCSANLAGVMDGYRFGNANNINMKKIAYSEGDVLKRNKGSIEDGYQSWSVLDAKIWRLIWEWDCSHGGPYIDMCIYTYTYKFSLNLSN
jgi:hypothetical protein